MGRCSRGAGVGRGNGPGSAKGQFKSGRPSANPHGRPRKPKPEPNGSLRDAAQRELGALVDIFENGVRKTVPQPEAMMRTLTARFSKAPVKDQIQIIRFFLSVVPSALEQRSPLPPQDSIAAFIEKLADEARREQESDQRFRDRRTG